VFCLLFFLVHSAVSAQRPLATTCFFDNGDPAAAAGQPVPARVITVSTRSWLFAATTATTSESKKLVSPTHLVRSSRQGGGTSQLTASGQLHHRPLPVAGQYASESRTSGGDDGDDMQEKE